MFLFVFFLRRDAIQRHAIETCHKYAPDLQLDKFKIFAMAFGLQIGKLGVLWQNEKMFARELGEIFLALCGCLS